MDVKQIFNRQVLCFLFSTFSISAVVFSLLIYFEANEHIALYMLCPGIAAVLTKLLFKEPLHTFRFGLIKPRFWFSAYFLPLLYIAPTYFLVWIVFENFPNEEYLEQLTSAVPDLTQTAALFMIVISNATIGVAITSFTFALGEELGWRGFLTSKLIEVTSFSNTSLVVATVWLLWHIPIILFSGYFDGPNMVFGIVCFTILVFSLSYLFTWLFLKSGSIWPVCILHASHNTFIQKVFSPITSNTEVSHYLTGEFGLGIAVGSCILTLLVLKISSGRNFTLS